MCWKEIASASKDVSVVRMRFRPPEKKLCEFSWVLGLPEEEEETAAAPAAMPGAGEGGKQAEVDVKTTEPERSMSPGRG